MFRSFIPVLYIRISPERLVATNVKTGESLSEVPEIAIAGKVINPFAHPRSMVSDFTSAELLLKQFVRRLCGKAWFSPSPRIVIHPLGDPEGGFTQVERRAFREMAMGSGAAQVVVWTGRELTNQEVAEGTYPPGGFAE
jgi:rod shape-determining protein MreB